MAIDITSGGVKQRLATSAVPRRLRLDLWGACAVAAAVLLVIVFFLPLWRMTLIAPQYPQDLNLTAYGTTMKGDLEEINSLNHYAGVKQINPDDVLELQLFPYLLFGFVAAVLVAAVVRQRLLRWAVAAGAWAFAFGFLADIQYWLYNYGHDLNEDAPLYPGPFTPRVLGSTKVVNFHSETMVSWGWWLILAAALLVTIGPTVIRFLRDSWSNTGAQRAAAVGAILLAAFAATAIRPHTAAAETGDLGAMIAAAAPGATVTVPAGTYRGPIVVDKPLTLVGVGWPVIDGQRAGDVVRITAEGVTLRGFVIQGSAREVSDEPSGIRVLGDRAVIEGNRVRDVLYGIALHESDGHVVRGNHVESVREFPAERRGHALYLYYTYDNLLADNVVSYAKDGIYINFSERNEILRNRVTDLRYGIHFMYAHHAHVAGNVFRDNLTGGSIMYSNDLTFEDNEFSYNRSVASGYGILFKDVDDIAMTGNRIHHNTIGLTMEGAPLTPGSFVRLRGNLVAFNQLALYFSTTVGAEIAANTFAGNLQQVETKGGDLAHHNAWSVDGRGNYWDDYRGFDADGDGVGDIAYRYEGAFDDLVQRSEAIRAYSFTFARSALDLTARWFPVYRPSPRAIDPHPLMAPTITFREEATQQTRAGWLAMGAALVVLPAGIAAAARRTFTARWQPC